MKGTEKQIKWAEDIKASIYRCFAAMEHNAESGLVKYNIADVEAVKAAFIPQIEAMQDAEMFIRFKDRFTQRFFEDAAINHNKFGF